MIARVRGVGGGVGTLFGGYLFVAIVGAWIAGIALRPTGPLDALGAFLWLALAAACVALAVGAAVIGRRVTTTTRWPRLLLAAGILGIFVALGAARAATADVSSDPAAVSRFAQGESVLLRGEVAAEPDLRAGFRYLAIETSAFSLDGGHTWQRAVGRVEAAVYGPDDWFAPAYGDSISLGGTLEPLGTAYAPPGTLARLSGARSTVVLARGGGNPLLAWLYRLRVALAQALQHALPEPEAALLIGILLGLKTPALRARLPLFTATGTIHQ